MIVYRCAAVTRRRQETAEPQADPPRRPAARPTIRDLAAVTGVSVTTVSHALNDKGRVDPETRKRVVDAAARLGYRASRTAQRLRSGKHGTIALVLPTVEPDVARDELVVLDYYMRIAASAARSAFAANYPLMLTPPIRTADDVHDLAVDGAVVVDPGRIDQRVALLEDAGVLCVTVERDPARPDRRWVVRADNEGNTRRLLDHLRDADAQRIALLGSTADWAWADETAMTYLRWCADEGRVPLIRYASMRAQERSAYAESKELLEEARPDAIVALAERYSGGVLRAARECGRRVPDDLLVAIASDSPHAREADPPVTAIDLRPDLQGAAAVEMLVARLAGEVPEAPMITPSELHVRTSTLRSGVAPAAG
jgi:DNA-binding LacI/PurR family transcriptional regulator